MNGNSGIIDKTDNVSNKIVETPYRKISHNSLHPHRVSGAPRIPVLLQATLGFSWAIILILGLGTIVVSYFSGCNGMTILLRAGASVLVSGITLWILTFLVVQGTIETAQKYLDEEAKEVKEKNKI